jgi:hypothetical protein
LLALGPHTLTVYAGGGNFAAGSDSLAATVEVEVSGGEVIFRNYVLSDGVRTRFALLPRGLSRLDLCR